MNCPHCGKAAEIERSNGSPSSRASTEQALNVYSRWRICIDGHRFKTIELDAGELSALRRKAYLHELSEARA